MLCLLDLSVLVGTLLLLCLLDLSVLVGTLPPCTSRLVERPRLVHVPVLIQLTLPAEREIHEPPLCDDLGNACVDILCNVS